MQWGMRKIWAMVLGGVDVPIEALEFDLTLLTVGIIKCSLCSLGLLFARISCCLLLSLQAFKIWPSLTNVHSARLLSFLVASFQGVARASELEHY
jgi:hypothetical protein